MDLRDVRYVVHLTVPQTMSEYAQQVGRVARDGIVGHALLFYKPEDSLVHRQGAARSSWEADTFDMALLAMGALCIRRVIWYTARGVVHRQSRGSN